MRHNRAKEKLAAGKPISVVAPGYTSAGWASMRSSSTASTAQPYGRRSRTCGGNRAPAEFDSSTFGF